MCYTIIQLIPKPWLCSLQHMEYVDHHQSHIDKRLLYRMSTSHSIFVVTSGKGSIVCSDRESHLEKGMIMFVPAGTSVKIEGSPWTESELQYYKLDLMVAELKEETSNALSRRNTEKQRGTFPKSRFSDIITAYATQLQSVEFLSGSLGTNTASTGHWRLAGAMGGTASFPGVVSCLASP